MEWVQVPKEHLLEYISYTEALSADHTKLQQQIKDSKELADIIEETWQQRLDKLTDEMLEPSNKSQYFNGMMRAYHIMRGAL